MRIDAAKCGQDNIRSRASTTVHTPYKSEFDDGKKQVERASRGIGKSDDTPGFVQSRVQRQCKTEF